MEITLEIAQGALLILHFVGLAALFGGFLVQLRPIVAGEGKIFPAMIHGAWTMLITGLLIVAVAQWRIAEGAGFELDHVKIAVKSVVVTAVLFLVYIYRKRQAVKRGEMLSIGALTFANIVIAVLW
ncbi:MAG: hypothetical protein RL198_646 [Actinomycetota bacterium]